MIFKSRNKQDNLAASNESERVKVGRRAGPSIITTDVVIEGKLITGGELQIDGTIHGDVRAASVVVDSQGAVHGEVVAEEIVVRGRIIGPLHAIHVHIFAGAHVEGDITHETISIENGAFVQGNMRRAEDPVDIGNVAALEDEQYFPEALDHSAGAQLFDGRAFETSPEDQTAQERPRLPGTDTGR
ncbi:bactofilin family protein [Rhodoligotrophos ferricapiens]|uniref:bactofilin family protein n=1 Tax=Rhodoligotrophos ferricapiens TaxID=3069264 RepID=UPI00315D4DF7